LERLHNSGRGHLVQEIEYEIGRIEELVHELRSHPSSTLEGEHGHRIEQRLAEHERRLAEELQRIESHV
jgi:transposase